MTGYSSSSGDFETTEGTPVFLDAYSPLNLISGQSNSFSITVGDAQLILSLTAGDVVFLNGIRDAFHSWLSSTDNYAAQIKSSIHLAFKLLEFLMQSRPTLSVVQRLFDVIYTDVMKKEEVHSVVQRLPDDSQSKRQIIRTYIQLCCALPSPRTGNSSLFAAAERGETDILMAFAGQGSRNSSCVDDMAELYFTYEPYVAPLVNKATELLRNLSKQTDVQWLFSGREIDLEKWMSDPDSRPSPGFLASSGVSFPVIGLVDLMHYCIMCRVLNMTPGKLRQALYGATGHSQGLVIAAAISTFNDSWDSFMDGAVYALELLFWMGYESHVAAPQSPLTPAVVQDSLEAGEGAPSQMLVVKGLSQGQLNAMISKCNKSLPQNQMVHAALHNGYDNNVISGPKSSLRSLTLRFREASVKDGVDQSRIPFSQRKPLIQASFLPVTAPFHSPYLTDAVTKVEARMTNRSSSSSSPPSTPSVPLISNLQIPVFDTETGQDIRSAYDPTTELTSILASLVMTKPLNWIKALQVGSPKLPSHVISFGWGRFVDLVSSPLEGRGIRIINGATFDSPSSPTSTSLPSLPPSKPYLFSPSLPSSHLLPPPSWKSLYSPTLTPSSSSSPLPHHLTTRLTPILRSPPLLVAGMTPTTIHPSFVSSILNSGYHAELAGGGYFSPEPMRLALQSLSTSISGNEIGRGRGITVNLIYASPKALQFQIPLLQSLSQKENLPLEGLTIGAGVPSPEVARGYIEGLGLRHLSLKPGGKEGIRNVIEIAKGNEDCAIILQWTGGRGGGHHSAEDFHEPLREMYGEIREQKNVFLVVGSGFGDGGGVAKYLDGSWSLGEGGRPEMPVDGVLFGSRMMVAKEAKTGEGAKELLVKAKGVVDYDDGDRGEGWERSYKGGDGVEVLTVTSEMGQPIHKLATRGVKLWKELDETIFSLERGVKRVEGLRKKKVDIVGKLNRDYMKVWFGKRFSTGEWKKDDGTVVELDDMTYGDVLRRVVELCFVAHQKRWIDPTYRDLLVDMAERTTERLHLPGVPRSTWVDDNPAGAVETLIHTDPSIDGQLLHPEDVKFFLDGCKLRGRKPVNFIPALDDDFEFYFKKDSLWQSEDLDAVIDQDPQRVCILQSPVSVGFSNRMDQTAGEILDEIHGDIVRILKDKQGDRMIQSESHIQASSNAATSDMKPFLAALFDESTYFDMASNGRRANPFCQILAEREGYSVNIDNVVKEVYVMETSTQFIVVRVDFSEDNFLKIHLYHRPTGFTDPAALSLLWKYDESIGRLIDETPDADKRVQDFYSRLWLKQEERSSTEREEESSPSFLFTQSLRDDLQKAIGHAFPECPTLDSGTLMPPESAVIAAWEAIMGPLLQPDKIQGNLLRLVHQSIEVSYVSGEPRLLANDKVKLDSSVRSVVTSPTGKSIAVDAKLYHEGHGRHVATVTSEFFVKGSFSTENDFREQAEPEFVMSNLSDADEAVVKDMPWLRLDNPDLDLESSTIVFDLTTKTIWSPTTTSDSPSPSSSQTKTLTSGTVSTRRWNGTKTPIGRVVFESSPPSSSSSSASANNNPVLDLLHRRATKTTKLIDLDQPGWGSSSSSSSSRKRTVKIPSSSAQIYASISGDFNPIHVCPIFATLAELPGGQPITHGMYTAALCRKVFEDLVLGTEGERLRRFKTEFLGVVRPGDVVEVEVRHTAMTARGEMVFEIFAAVGEEKVLRGFAEVEQPRTAYLFTGQGSQSKGMGMDLYESSPVARKLWDEMDGLIAKRFGWSILDMVRNNPKSLTIHFRGAKGKKYLENYLAMGSTRRNDAGEEESVPIIPGLSDRSESHTFYDERGLLHATQFAQPAILLLEKAWLEHLKSRGVVQERGSVYAGHSLGEYGALFSMSDIVEFRDALSISVYRGLMMQFAIEKDENGSTGFSMVAVNPKRMGKGFTDNALQEIVNYIAEESGKLLEIVNLNVESEQYVCAGHVHNIHVLTETLNQLYLSGPSVLSSQLTEFLSSPSPSSSSSSLRETVSSLIHSPTTTSLPTTPTFLARGRATIPLHGIDVPFHSTRLRYGIPRFREILRRMIKAEDLDLARLEGRFLPNVLGKPFVLGGGGEDGEGREEGGILGEAARITGSEVLKGRVEGLKG